MSLKQRNTVTRIMTPAVTLLSAACAVRGFRCGRGHRRGLRQLHRTRNRRILRSHVVPDSRAAADGDRCPNTLPGPTRRVAPGPSSLAELENGTGWMPVNRTSQLISDACRGWLTAWTKKSENRPTRFRPRASAQWLRRSASMRRSDQSDCVRCRCGRAGNSYRESSATAVSSSARR